MNRKTLQHGLLLSTSILVSMAGYGRRAYAANVCELQSGTTFICSGLGGGLITVDADNADVVAAGDLALTENGDGGLLIKGTGHLKFTDDPASVIDVESDTYGLGVKSIGKFDDGEATFEGVEIDTKGTISGGAIGIYAYAFTAGFGGIYDKFEITVDGKITGTKEWGIYAKQDGPRGIDITVDNDGKVSGAGGIKANSTTNNWGGDVTVTVDGDVESTDTDPYDGFAYAVSMSLPTLGSGTLILNEGATVTAALTGARITTNFGDITANIGADATISGGAYGLYLTTAEGATEVTVDGTVTADTGLALNADTGIGNLNLTVGEDGKVSGRKGILTRSNGESTGTLSITVDGEVDATGSYALYAYGSFEDGSVVALTLGKEGRLTSQSEFLGAVKLSGAKVSAVVAGTVTAGTGQGALRISGDETSLELRSGYAITGVVGATGFGTDALQLGGTETGADAGTFDVSLLDDGVDIAEQFQGFDSFEKVGTGDWTLTGTLAATIAAWSVKEGRLFVDATMSSTSFDVAADATLGGTGTIGGFRLVSGSHVAPGSAEGPGTLTVDDKVAFGGGSYFDVTVGKDEASKLVVQGGATIDRGATVSLNRIDDEADYTNGKSYVILSTEIGYKGKFSETIDEDFAFLEVALVYEGKDVLLQLGRNDVDFDAVAGTPDQKAVAAAIEGLEGGNAIYDAITVLDEDGARVAFETLSGNTLASVPGMVIGEAASFDALLEARSDAVAAAGSESAYVAPAAPANAAAAATADLLAPLALDSGFWLRGTGTLGSIEGDGNGSGADYRTGGIAAGVDTWVTPNLLAGAAIDYALMGESFADGGGTATVSSASVALYSRYNADALTLDGRVGFGVTDTDTERAVVVGSDSYTALGAFAGSRFQASASAGYDLMMLGGTQLRPVASVGYVRLAEDGFTETGADVYGLTVSDRVTESLKSGVGFELTQRVALGDRADGLSLTAKAVWQHEFLDDHTTFDAAFADYPSAAFSVDGPVVGRDSAVLGFEADAQASDTMSLYGRYDLRLNPDRVDQSVSVGLRGAW